MANPSEKIGQADILIDPDTGSATPNSYVSGRKKSVCFRTAKPCVLQFINVGVFGETTLTLHEGDNPYPLKNPAPPSKIASEYTVRPFGGKSSQVPAELLSAAEAAATAFSGPHEIVVPAAGQEIAAVDAGPHEIVVP